ncbi:selenocysteine-specific translation elongation factor [Candidatus Laterigemmans baculatus]|uniref:selenocysteine-specific translation elongation factor n=1 Tax=Candidatus Laterigemmans baculatus TaxID=2770505 RepID=UPI0013DC4EEE|nr:selenocysteine-specific translation elongation factor [Candidatus Laterigemmans baculatus]
MTRHLILGTAGHIDHGKTELVKALTGTDADRLPDEKRRGMTIDLGFAELRLGDLQLGIVDVPGHERLVRNMLCGAMAIDLALLVVAANESVKPQTREHLEILKHLGIEHGVIVLSKCDLVEPHWLDCVAEEVRSLVADSPLAQARAVGVSSLTGQGLPELRAALAEAAEHAARSPRRQQLQAPFRMAIDRAFTVEGHGTIVTGSVASGLLRVGEEVALEPQGTAVRVRGLQSHGVAVDRVARGQRAAINLVGVSLEEAHRGDVLAPPGYLTPSCRLHVALSLNRPPMRHASASDPPPRNPRRKISVRVHLGTKEIQATLRWLEPRGDDFDQDGSVLLAELELSEPAVCVWGQPVVVRSQAPVATLGGGRVVDPHPRPLRRRATEEVSAIRELASESPRARLASLYFLRGFGELGAAEVVRRGGILGEWESLRDSLVAERVLERLPLAPGRLLHVHAQVLERAMTRVEQLLAKYHQRNRTQAVFPLSVLHKIFSGSESPRHTAQWLAAVVERMRSQGRLTVTPAGVALPGAGPQLSKPQQQLYEEIIETHRRCGCAPPAIDQLAPTAATRRSVVPKLVELAIAQGHLVRVCSAWCLHAEVEGEVRRTLVERLGESSFAVRDLRELLHVSRKYLVPLCEYLDRIGFTRREGDRRTIVGSGGGIESQPDRLPEEVSS